MTITMDDEVFDWLQRVAARRNVNVSGLIGDLLAEMMRSSVGYAGAMHEALKFKAWGSSEGPKLSRDETHMRVGR